MLKLIGHILLFHFSLDNDRNIPDVIQHGITQRNSYIKSMVELVNFVLHEININNGAKYNS